MVKSRNLMSLFVTAVLLLIPAASLEGAGKKLEVRMPIP